MTQRIIIIGAGQAGAQAAASLRQAGFDGEIVLIGEEATPPYQRPPLSKAYLTGELSVDRLALKPAKFYADAKVTLMLGVRVASLDAQSRAVVFENGDRQHYDKLLLATGAPPRQLPLPGADLNGVQYLRRLVDSDRLRPTLRRNGRLLIVGAGYIGLEVAAVARKAGRDVCVIEQAARPLARVAGPVLGSFFERLHRDAGVAFHFNASLTRFDGDDSADGGDIRAAMVNGETIPCDTALIGIGAIPQTTLAQTAGLAVDNGVVVDETAQTSDPHIWAAGDCTNFPSPFYGRRLRLESVPNAIEQAKTAAMNMARAPGTPPKTYDALPWFWSDQYDVKLQSAGLSDGADASIVRGDPAVNSFSVWHLQEGAPIAVDAVNDPAAFAVGRRIIPLRQGVDVKKLADPEIDLKSLIS